jgi:DNA-directed RNA polymerase sigma subunit (sigma70/sigma32)
MALAKDDPVSMYRRELATIQPLTNEEEDRLFREAEKPGEQGEGAKRRLIESTLPLVLSIADQHAASGLSPLDLIEEGNLALMRAIDTFPQSGRSDFSVYATGYVKDAISSAIARSKSQ